MYKIMLVDDDKFILASLQRILHKQSNWHVDAFDDPHAAVERMKTESYDLFMSDYYMPRMSGVDFLVKVMDTQPDAMRIILSGQADMESVLEAINEAGIYRFITKPVQDHELIATITQALQLYETLAENKRLSDQVRNQNSELDKRKSVLERLAHEHPDLAHVDWTEDGCIILEENKGD